MWLGPYVSYPNVRQTIVQQIHTRGKNIKFIFCRLHHSVIVYPLNDRSEYLSVDVYTVCNSNCYLVFLLLCQFSVLLFNLFGNVSFSSRLVNALLHCYTHCHRYHWDFSVNECHFYGRTACIFLLCMLLNVCKCVSVDGQTRLSCKKCMRMAICCCCCCSCFARH